MAAFWLLLLLLALFATADLANRLTNEKTSHRGQKDENSVPGCRDPGGDGTRVFAVEATHGVFVD